MEAEAKRCLYDSVQPAQHITELTSGKTLAAYERGSLLRSAVDRPFAIIGEALARLARYLDSLVMTRQ